MASGARPSSNQRSEAPSPGKKTRNIAHESLAEFEAIQCVICSSRACSHRYYGVAACHGCKCFFWRTVKHQQQYICRYNKNCEISMDHRNACRYCRFQRCLNSGMQPEAVRMQTDPAKSTAKRSCGSDDSARQSSGTADIRPSDEEIVFQVVTRKKTPPVTKKAREENHAFVKALIALDQRASELADFSENEAPKRLYTVEDLFYCPEYMDCYRTRVNYCVRLRRVTAEEMDFCKYRTLTKAFDYIRSLDTLGNTMFSIQDQIVLLRYGYAPLTIFDITSGTLEATKDGNLLCLPTGVTVSRNEEMVSNSFMNQKIVASTVDSLMRLLSDLQADQQETTMLKAIIALNAEIHGLSHDAVQEVNQLRDRVHAALYQHCTDVCPDKAAIRFAKLLHVLPKVSLLARDLVEHIRMVHTFNADKKTADPIFYQLFGDIFQEERESSLEPVSPPSSVNCKYDNPLSTLIASPLLETSTLMPVGLKQKQVD